MTIDTLLTKTVKKLNLNDQFNQHNICKHYSDLFGKEISSISFPEKLIKGTLYVTVKNSPWLMELSYMKDEFKKKINGLLKKRVIRNVVFRVGKPPVMEKMPVYEPMVDLKGVKLDDKTKWLIKESVKDIKDTALKRSIVRAETAYYKRNKLDKR